MWLVKFIGIIIYAGYHLYCPHYIVTVIPGNFEGRKFCGFHCKLAGREIFILKKKQWLKETLYAS